MTRKYFNIVIFFIFLLTVENVFAPPPPPPPVTPIDGGIYLLLALGAVFGVKKIWKKDK